MSRRKVRYPTVTAPWREEFRALFAPLDAIIPEGQAPATVRIYHGKAHFTIVAKVPAERGGVITLKTRAPR
jgi:hypothetical protein